MSRFNGDSKIRLEKSRDYIKIMSDSYEKMEKIEHIQNQKSKERFNK